MVERSLYHPEYVWDDTNRAVGLERAQSLFERTPEKNERERETAKRKGGSERKKNWSQRNSSKESGYTQRPGGSSERLQSRERETHEYLRAESWTTTATKATTPNCRRQFRGPFSGYWTARQTVHDCRAKPPVPPRRWTRGQASSRSSSRFPSVPLSTSRVASPPRDTAPRHLPHPTAPRSTTPSMTPFLGVFSTGFSERWNPSPSPSRQSKSSTDEELGAPAVTASECGTVFTMAIRPLISFFSNVIFSASTNEQYAIRFHSSDLRHSQFGDGILRAVPRGGQGALAPSTTIGFKSFCGLTDHCGLTGLGRTHHLDTSRPATKSDAMAIKACSVTLLVDPTTADSRYLLI
jgi:hypothetical protein